LNSALKEPAVEKTIVTAKLPINDDVLAAAASPPVNRSNAHLKRFPSLCRLSFWARFSISCLLTLSCAAPAHAWWLFKHHHHGGDENNNDPAAPVSPPVVSPPARSSIYQSSTFSPRFTPVTTSKSPTAKAYPVTTNPVPSQALPLSIPTAPDKLANCEILTSRLKTAAIRVGLATGASTAEIVALDGAALKDYASGASLATMAPQTRWSLKLERKCLVITPKDWFQLASRPTNELQSSFSSADSHIRPAAYRVSDVPRLDFRSFSQMALRLPVGPLSNYKSFVLVPNTVEGQPGLFAVNGKFYRGNLVVLPQSSLDTSANTTGQNYGFSLINELDLDDYLLGVVPAEMPSSWPQESLKAQAIAARTYAYANLGKHGKDGYDLKDTTDDQVYGGVKAETSASNAAVAATSGVVMTYEGNPICAYFHSASGGITESADNVWGKPLPYLKAVMDYDQQSPLATWNRTYSVDQLEAALAQDVGKLLSIDVVSRSQSKRACQLLMVGSRGAQIINAETVRRLLKLPSTNFNVSVLDSAYQFSGRGYGHGLGLSQWGAKGLAEQGYNAAQIVTYYYRNVTLERVACPPSN